MYLKYPHDATTAVPSPYRPTPRLSTYRPRIASPVCKGALCAVVVVSGAVQRVNASVLRFKSA